MLGARPRLTLSFFVSATFGLGVFSAAESPGPVFQTPTRQLDVHEYPDFADDLQFARMELALTRQLQRFRGKDLHGFIRLGGKLHPLERARASLLLFQELVQEHTRCLKKFSIGQCQEIFNSTIREKFNVYAPDLRPGDPRYGSPRDSFFTGYHTLSLEARSKPVGEYTHAVYKNPVRPAEVRQSRGAIDFQGALAGLGLELFYGKNLHDLYLLHTEGSGYIRLVGENGTREFYITYDGTNGRPWRWISQYMMDKGWIQNASVAAVRRHLDAHPEHHQEIFSSCPSYVYFRATESPPLGCDQVPVTDGRSLATDKALYLFKGLLAYVESERPVDDGVYNMDEEDAAKVPHQPFSRFFLDQDTGGAIKGKGRADIYFGRDRYAHYAATYQAREGRLFFLMAR